MTPDYTIRECLQGYTNETLALLCARWQLDASAKPGRLRALERILRDPLHIESQLRELGPEPIRLLHLVASWGAPTIWDLRQVPGLYSRNDALNTLLECARLGFLMAAPQAHTGAFSLSLVSRNFPGDDAAPRVFVPETVRKRLPELPPPNLALPAAGGLDIEPDAPRPDRGTFVFLETLRFVEELAPRVTAAGDLHKTDEAKAFELAREAELPKEAFSLGLMIARQVGCVETRAGRLVTTPKASEWAGLDRTGRTRWLFEGYLAAPALPDVALFFQECFARLDEHLPKGTLRRTYHRRVVSQLLQATQPDTWYRVESVSDVVRRLDPNLMFLDEPWRSIHGGAAGGASSGWREHNWQGHERRLMVWMVKVLMVDLGMVELAGEGKLFRLTPAGRHALGIGPAPTEAEPLGAGAILVQPNFEVMVYMDRCPPVLRRTLDTCCQRIRGGMVSTYQLTQESVYRGLQSGGSGSSIIELFERHSGRPLPANVVEQFQTWTRKVDAICVRPNCTVLECATAEEAEAAAAAPGTRRLGKRYVLLNEVPEDVPAVDYRQPLRPRLDTDSAVQLRVPWESANLFALRRLKEYAEVRRNGTGDYVVRLDRDRIAAHDDGSLIAAQLEALLGQPLPTAMRVALQAWTGAFEPAVSRSASIVRFSDPDMCEAALSLDDVAPHIEGRLGLFALVIRQGQLSQFKRKLRAHGIDVRAGDAIADPAPPEKWAETWIEQQRARSATAAAPAADAPKRGKKTAAAPEEALPSYPIRIMAEILEDAIVRRRPVLISYLSAWSEQPAVRRVDPVSVDLSSASPNLSGYCHQQQGARVFRLSQIAGIRVLEYERF